MNEYNQTTSNTPLVSLHLSEETLDGLAELGEVLKKIHKRMVSEGYEIREGRILKINPQTT